MKKKQGRKSWKRVVAFAVALSVTATGIPVSAAEALDKPISQQFGGEKGNQVEMVTEHQNYAQYSKGVERTY